MTNKMGIKYNVPPNHEMLWPEKKYDRPKEWSQNGGSCCMSILSHANLILFCFIAWVNNQPECIFVSLYLNVNSKNICCMLKLNSWTFSCLLWLLLMFLTNRDYMVINCKAISFRNHAYLQECSCKFHFRI